MGPEERKVSSAVHTDALKLFHSHVGKLLCWSYIKLLKANKATLLGSLKVYFYLMMTFALGVRYSSRKPTRAASVEHILKRTKNPHSFQALRTCKCETYCCDKWKGCEQRTRGWWNSIGVWNTIVPFQSLFKTSAAHPAWSGFARLRREKVPIIVSLEATWVLPTVCCGPFTIRGVLIPVSLTADPVPGPAALAVTPPHALPPPREMQQVLLPPL